MLGGKSGEVIKMGKCLNGRAKKIRICLKNDWKVGRLGQKKIGICWKKGGRQEGGKKNQDMLGKWLDAWVVPI